MPVLTHQPSGAVEQAVYEAVRISGGASLGECYRLARLGASLYPRMVFDSTWMSGQRFIKYQCTWCSRGCYMKVTAFPAAESEYVAPPGSRYSYNHGWHTCVDSLRVSASFSATLPTWTRPSQTWNNNQDCSDHSWSPGQSIQRVSLCPKMPGPFPLLPAWGSLLNAVLFQGWSCTL